MRAGQGARTAAVVADVGRRAAQTAGVILPADAVVVGAAGAGALTEQRELAAAVLATGVGRRALALTDAEIALASAFGDGAGILLNAGTGTIAYARDPAGRLHRAGGYGWQMGDEGGGYWLGRRALELAGQARDRRVDSPTLLARVLRALHLGDFDDLVRWSVTAGPTQVAALATELLAAARDGEPPALEAVEQAAGHLAELVAALGSHFPGATTVPVATTGGLLHADSPLARAFSGALAARMPRAHPLDHPVDAPAGALALAARLLETE